MFTHAPSPGYINVYPGAVAWVHNAMCRQDPPTLIILSWYNKCSDDSGAWVHIVYPRACPWVHIYVPRRRRLGTHFVSFCTECYPSVYTSCVSSIFIFIQFHFPDQRHPPLDIILSGTSHLGISVILPSMAILIQSFI